MDSAKEPNPAAERAERPAVTAQYVIASCRGGILSVFYDNGKPVRLDFSGGKTSLVGNIYLGRVQHIVKNLDAAFVDIGEEKPAFLTDAGRYALHGKSEAGKPLLVEGGELIVKVKKDAHGLKGPSVTASFREKSDRSLLQKASFQKAPVLLKAADPTWRTVLRECFSGTHAERTEAEILTDLPEVFQALTGQPPEEEPVYVKKLPERFRKTGKPLCDAETGIPVRFRNDPQIRLTSLYSMETLLTSCTERKVWLKSGGFLVIDPVEAMTVIDVNSGKFDKKGARDSTIRRVDLEAAEEAMQQIRLRNLSGIIVIDFIDLSTPEDQEALLRRLRELASLDPVRTEVIDITKLNLVEITRRKSGRTLAEQLI